MEVTNYDWTSNPTNFGWSCINLDCLYDTGADVSLSKGLFVRPSYIPYPTKTDFVDSKKYLSGLNPFTNNRPLNAVEISYLKIYDIY